MSEKKHPAPGERRAMTGDYGTGADGTLATGRPGSASPGADARIITPEPPTPDDATFAGDYGTGAGGQLASSQPDTDTERAAADEAGDA
jgi:hypothetical protein